MVAQRAGRPAQRSEEPKESAARPQLRFPRQLLLLLQLQVQTA